MRNSGHVLAINRIRRTVRRRVADTILRLGDALLILAPPDRVEKLASTRNLLVFSERQARLRKDRLWWLPIPVLPMLLIKQFIMTGLAPRTFRPWAWPGT